jgi:preprotein translocase subunit SecD
MRRMRVARWLVVPGMCALLLAGCGDEEVEPTAEEPSAEDVGAGDSEDEGSSDEDADDDDDDDDESLGDAAPSVSFEIAPVAELLPPDPSCETAGEASIAGVGSAGEACFVLGDPVVTEVDVESAEAVDDGVGGWVVDLVLTEEGIEPFNETAADCFEARATCPSSQMAIVVDGEVLSAPSIQTPEFERDEIRISGDFDEDSASDLAAALGG